MIQNMKQPTEAKRRWPGGFSWSLYFFGCVCGLLGYAIWDTHQTQNAMQRQLDEHRQSMDVMVKNERARIDIFRAEFAAFHRKQSAVMRKLCDQSHGFEVGSKVCAVAADMESDFAAARLRMNEPL